MASVASEVNKYPVVLALENMTHYWGSAKKIWERLQKAMEGMELGDGENFVALTTDNPTVMQSYQNQFWANLYFPAMKKII